MLLLALALLLSPTQDDPALLYREGLYEEIDQGNLEKAMDLYGRILKGNADAAMKARALYRRGSCLEKGGKKKEAEQAYRDLSDRFPEQAELVKLARGRLAALSAVAPSGAQSLEAEIQQLILDLGARAAQQEQREKAVERLTLIGDAAIPDLKRALGHKDRTLAGAAARVLVNLEQYDNLYDVFLRAEADFLHMRAFGLLLKASAADRERFCKESEKLDPTALRNVLDGASASIKDPRLQKSIEDRLVAAAPNDVSLGSLASAWWSASEPGQLAALIRRLCKEQDPPRILHLMQVLGSRPDRKKTYDVSPELAAELKDAATRDGTRYFREWLVVLVPYLTPEILLKELIPARLKAADLKKAQQTARSLPLKEGPSIPGLVEFAFDVLDSNDYRDEVKQALCEDTTMEAIARERPQLMARLLKFYAGYLARNWKKVEELRGPKEQFQTQAWESLVRSLPPEAEGWETVFEIHFAQKEDGLWLTLSQRIKASERLRSFYIQAAFKALAGDSPEPRKKAARDFDRYATAPELRALSKVLPQMPKELTSPLVRDMVAGFKPLSVEERTAEIKAIAPLFKSPNLFLRQQMILEFRLFIDASMDEIMKEAISDPDLQNRRIVFDFWGNRRTPEALPLLLQALKDPDDDIKFTAVMALSRSPSLDAVPALLELLKSSNNNLRGAAQTALKAIQQYYDEQDQWRKWYEDTKKRIPKDK